jgi:hypothetical protein
VSVAYDRDVLIDVVVGHWPTATSGCSCGWQRLGHSFAEHIADVYEGIVAQTKFCRTCSTDISEYTTGTQCVACEAEERGVDVDLTSEPVS